MKVVLHSFLMSALVLSTVAGCGPKSTGHTDDKTPGGTATGSGEVNPESPPQMGEDYAKEAEKGSETPAMQP